MTITIINEFRSPTRVVSLERMPAGETMGKYRVKDVHLKYCKSEEEARALFAETTQPMPKKRGRPPKT